MTARLPLTRLAAAVPGGVAAVGVIAAPSWPSIAVVAVLGAVGVVRAAWTFPIVRGRTRRA